MTVVRDAGSGRDPVVRLEGDCPVEDAETLLALLLDHPGAVVEWTACTKLHAAVFQVLLRLRPTVTGSCGDPFVARWLKSVGTRDG